MKLTRGSDLTPAQRAEVLRAYMMRWTVENNGSPGNRPPAQAQGHLPTDAEWIDLHAFWITNAGRLARNRRYAEPAVLAEFMS